MSFSRAEFCLEAAFAWCNSLEACCCYWLFLSVIDTVELFLVSWPCVDER